jgi:hypothetical protein
VQFDLIDRQIESLAGGMAEYDCDSAAKRAISEAIANEVNKRIPRAPVECSQADIEELKTRGIVRLNTTLEEKKIKEIVSYLAAIPVFGGHVSVHSDGIPRFLEQGAKKYPFGSYAQDAIIDCPHLLEIALRPEILSLVVQYLGCTPTIYSIHCWWSFADKGWHWLPWKSPPLSQDYHRDVDDFRFLALFIYLTDVQGGRHGGQHQYIVESHDENRVGEILGGDRDQASRLFMPKLRKYGYKQAKLYRRLFAKQITDITGLAGSLFLADTYGLHRGVPPRNNDRLVCWIRYGLRNNLGYRTLKTRPVRFARIENRVGSSIQTKFMLRLLASDGAEET